MSEHKFIAGLFFFTFLEIILFSMYAMHNANINCPHINVQENKDVLTWVINSIGIFFSPCSGLPYWVYLLIFIPLAIALVGYLTPFVGG